MKLYALRHLVILLTAGLLAAPSLADTFRHKQTGETFNGFMTQKTTRDKTLVFNSDKNEMSPISLSEYDVTYNTQGRKNTVVIVPITQSEVLLSQVVSETVAKSIVDASNKGPQAIIIQIDNPGGRGDYMKTIASAISQTTNCPVYAHISGRQYGGAFSAAALIAMACDKVFISPTGSIGAVAPGAGAAATEDIFLDYISTYSSDSLVSYNVFAVALANERNRPALLVRALLDKRLSVEEVTDGTKRDFVQSASRQPNQTRIRTLAEGIDSSVSPDSLTPGMVATAVLSLQPAVAIEVGLVDHIAESTADVLSTLKLQDVQLTRAAGIENAIKKYSAARRNIAESLSRIQWLESRAALLEEQLGDVERQLRTGTVTREVTQRQGVSNRRTITPLPRDYERYYFDPGSITTGRSRSGRDGTTTRSRSDRGTPRQTETVVTQEPAVSIEQVQRELVAALNELIVEYRRAMNQAKRWPGSLPPDIPYQVLENNWNSAVTYRDFLLRQSVYDQTGFQQPAPTSTDTRRRR